MVCKNTHCRTCGEKLSKKARDSYSDGYPFGQHEVCEKYTSLRAEIERLQALLRRAQPTLIRYENTGNDEITTGLLLDDIDAALRGGG